MANKTETMTTAEFNKLPQNKPRNKKDEEDVQLAVCKYLKTVYPHVIFFCDLSSGQHLPIHIATRFAKMRSSRALPDLFIPYPRKNSSAQFEYCGLFIELKKDGIRLKNGALPDTKHMREQHEILRKLRELGYLAKFAVGSKEAIKLIDEYLK